MQFSNRVQTTQANKQQQLRSVSQPKEVDAAHITGEGHIGVFHFPLAASTSLLATFVGNFSPSDVFIDHFRAYTPRKFPLNSQYFTHQFDTELFKPLYFSADRHLFGFRHALSVRIDC